MSTDQRYWFRAKRYGWGWGLPCSWQGWVVLLVWLAAFLAGVRFLPRWLPAHLAFMVVMVVLLLMVCYCKGEPPAWRWGDRQ
jgi:uncharacterized membrane protein YhaH (DUF805 family)